MYTTQFKVVAVSANTNSFGLHQCVMLAKNGVAYKACANYLNVPKKGDILEVPALLDKDKNPTDKFNFSALSFEIPEKMPIAPKEVIAEVWN